MPNYVVLYKFTDQGAKNIKSTVERAAQVKVESEQRGFRIHGVYWTEGRYDMVVVLDAPDEQSMVAGMIKIAGAGNVHSETMRAFTAEEMTQILQKVE